MRYSAIAHRMRGLGSDKWAVHFRARAMREAGEDILLLSIGEPDFDTPPAIVDAAVDSMRRGRTRYSNARGERATLQAIADKYAHRTGRAIGTDQVIYLPGSQNALFVALATLADASDDVLLPEPYYATYDGVVAAIGAGQVTIPLSPDDGFHLRPEQLEAAITPASRVLMLNSPNNPTGATLSRSEILAIGEVAEAHDLWILSDEVYEHLVYGEALFASPFDEARLAERTVVVSSLSKSHAMPGFRCGWAVGPREFSATMQQISQAMLFGSQPFLQDAAVVALEGSFAEVDEMRVVFTRRAALISSRLGGAGAVRCPRLEGGMFAMVDVRPTGVSGVEFADRLLDQYRVAVMPGEAFGMQGAGHVRVSLTADETILATACDRMQALGDELMRS